MKVKQKRGRDWEAWTTTFSTTGKAWELGRQETFRLVMRIVF
jgi:hypothetical protein